MWEKKKKKKSDTQGAAELSMMLLPYFDTFCDLLLNNNMTEWNLIHFFTIKNSKILLRVTSFMYLSYNSAPHITPHNSLLITVSVPSASLVNIQQTIKFP